MMSCVASQQEPEQEKYGQNVFHNMSAPPRTKITLQPLKLEHELGFGASSTGAEERSSSGLRWVTRIDLEKLIQRYFPKFIAYGRYGSWCDLRPWVDPSLQNIPRDPLETLPTTHGNPHLSLRCCLSIARIVNGARGVDRDAIEALRSTPFEQLCDEFRDFNNAIDPIPLNLPPMGLLITADKRERPFETSAAKVFYILSRLNGSTFVREGSTMVDGHLSGIGQLDLWVPA